jgi:hypothetical protein
MKGVLPWSVRWADFYPALSALVSPIQNLFFLTIYYFILCIPIAPKQLGLAVVQGRLSLNMCLLSQPSARET